MQVLRDEAAVLNGPLPLWVACFWLGLLGGWMLGVQYPPCCPGLQRSCDTEDYRSGVQYCRKSGWGWERCQLLKGDPYPQALWRRPRF